MEMYNSTPVSGPSDDDGGCDSPPALERTGTLDMNKCRMMADTYTRAELLGALRVQTEKHITTQSQVTTPSSSGSKASKASETKFPTSQDAAEPLALEGVGAFTQQTTQDSLDSDAPIGKKPAAPAPEEATYEFPMTPADDDDEAEAPAADDADAARGDDDTVAEEEAGLDAYGIDALRSNLERDDEPATKALEHDASDAYDLDAADAPAEAPAEAPAPAPPSDEKPKKKKVEKKVKTKVGKPKAKRGRPKKDAAPSSPTAPDADDEPEDLPPAKKAKFTPAVGMKVHAMWGDDDQVYYPAVIAKVNRDATVNLDYEDGAFWDHAPAKVLREITWSSAKKQKKAAKK